MIKNHVGRPNTREQSMLKHLNKMYTGKEFTSEDIVNSYRLQLLRNKTDPLVQVGMGLRKLKKKGIIAVVGEKETNKRGVNNKLYVLKGGK